MKLVSLNVNIFEANNSLLIKFLRNQNADIICLQEATRSLQNSVDDKYISKDAVDIATPDLKHSFFGPSVVIDNFEKKDFHGKEVFRFAFGGLLEFGTYTKSRFKIIKGQHIFVENFFTYATDFSKWPDEDYRAVLVSDHYSKGKKLRILNYHGIWTRDKLGNEKSLIANNTINDLALQAEGEVIICGDFNLFPNTPSMQIFEKNFVSLVDKFNVKTTRPATNELHTSKRNVVDYIWVSKRIKIKKFKVVDADVSDHMPLILDFEL